MTGHESAWDAVLSRLDDAAHHAKLDPDVHRVHVLAIEPLAAADEARGLA